MQEVYQRTCSDILRESGNKADVSVYNLEKAFDSGVIHYGPKKEPYDFKKNFYGNLRSVCNELLQELNAAYDNMINVDVILLTGGTGVAWERYIRDFYKDTKAPVSYTHLPPQRKARTASLTGCAGVCSGR